MKLTKGEIQALITVIKEISEAKIRENDGKGYSYKSEEAMEKYLEDIFSLEK